MATSTIKRGLALKQIPTNLFTWNSSSKVHVCSASDLATALGDFSPIAFFAESNSTGVIYGASYNSSSSSNRLAVQGWIGRDAATTEATSFSVYAIGY